MISQEAKHRLDDWKKQMHIPDMAAGDAASKRWDSISKPLDSMGLFEHQIIKIAACTRNADICIEPARLFVMCADNGIVSREVTQTGSEVTAVVAKEIAAGRGNVSRMAREAGIDIEVVNIGIAEDLSEESIVDRCVRHGTRDFLNEPAMTEDEVLQAIAVGVERVGKAHERNEKIMLVGEMGIGNTTTSTALAAVLLGIDPSEITGRGAGLSNERLLNKQKVIEQGLKQYGYMSDDGALKPVSEPYDVFELLCSLGGLDIAGLVGIYLGAAIHGMPVIIDGVITAVAALCAERMFSGCSGYMIGSHVGREPAMRSVLEKLDLSAPITAGLALGEGSGAVMEYQLLKSALSIYDGATFSDMKIENYSRYDGYDEIDIRR